jgi:hypothetical protein
MTEKKTQKVSHEKAQKDTKRKQSQNGIELLATFL